MHYSVEWPVLASTGANRHGGIEMSFWRIPKKVWLLAFAVSVSCFSSIGPGFGQEIGGNADLDGDGWTDIAVYQTSTGNWFALGSEIGFFTPALNFGGSGFIPVVGDYDGDGQQDAAVYQTSTGNWFILQSSAGFRIVPSFGGPGFDPVLPILTVLRSMGLL
jgi:VCBS repeat protein